MSSFSIPLSGLTASSTELSTVSNNLANLNTVGYKDQQVQFSDLFYENLGTDGAGDPIQQGAGTAVSSISSDFTEGNVTSTGIDTDVAINGNGFFVVQSNGIQSYTRAGNFEVGTDNLLETTDGQQVLGYPAVDGVVNTSAGLGPLALGAGTTSPSTATTTVQLTSNLSATDPTNNTYSTNVTVYDSLGASHNITFTFTNESTPAVAAVPAQAATGVLTMSSIPTTSQTVTIGNQTYTFTDSDPGTGTNDVLIGSTIAETVANLVNAINGNTADTAGDGAGGYGSGTSANPAVTAADQGDGVIDITASTTGTASDFTATSSGSALAWSSGAGNNGANAIPGTPAVVNTWGYDVTIPAADLGGASSAQPVTLASGTLVFDGNGDLISPTSKNGSVAISTADLGTMADGANALSFNWDLYSQNGNGLLTQTAAPDSTSSIQQNGNASGTLQNFSIGSDGTITGSFSNGTTAVLGQIALANFADEQGLSRNGDNDYGPTLASGQATVGTPGTGGLGTISGGSLEQSNVNIATEFSNLIIAQSSYEANARVVTTFDQVMQDTINIKQ